MRNAWILMTGAVLLTTASYANPDGPNATSDMPSAAEVREALDTLRRFERALGTESAASTEVRTEEGLWGASAALTVPTVASAGTPWTIPSPTVVAPSTFSLNLEGDLELGGFVFQNGTPFLHNDGSTNTALGLNALISATPGIPSGASGLFNSAFGYDALRFNTEGFGNTASGRRALYSNTTGYRNTATGERALQDNLTGSLNTATGVRALQFNTDGCCNTATGYRALRSNTTGFDNTASGYGALADNTSGYSNSAFGDNALSGNTTGVRNTAVGRNAMTTITTGSWNTAIGYQAGSGWQYGNESDNIAVGRGATGSSQESGTIRIGGGDHQTSTFIEGIAGTVVTGVNVVIDGADQLGVVASSSRFKQDIHDLEGMSRRLQDLRPVSFRYKDDLTGGTPNPLEYGLIAEEVAEIFPELVVADEEGRPFTVRYHLLTPLLLSEVQRQEAEDIRRESEIEDLRQQLADQRQVTADLRRRLEELARKL